MPPKREPTPLDLDASLRRAGAGRRSVVPSASTNPSAMRAAIPFASASACACDAHRLVGDDERRRRRARSRRRRARCRSTCRRRPASAVAMTSWLLDRVPAADGDGVDLAQPGHAGPEVEQALAPDELDRRVGGGRRRRWPEVQLARADVDLEADLVGQAPQAAPSRSRCSAGRSGTVSPDSIVPAVSPLRWATACGDVAVAHLLVGVGALRAVQGLRAVVARARRGSPRSR